MPPSVVKDVVKRGESGILMRDTIGCVLTSTCTEDEDDDSVGREPLSSPRTRRRSTHSVCVEAIETRTYRSWLLTPQNHEEIKAEEAQ